MKKGVIIKLDKERTLRYGINALARIEDSIGIFLIGEDIAVFTPADACPPHDSVLRNDAAGTVVADHTAQHPVVGSRYVVILIN